MTANKLKLLSQIVMCFLPDSSHVQITRSLIFVFMCFQIRLTFQKEELKHPKRKYHCTGLEIATHWLPVRPKIEHWQLNFQNWSPAGDSHFVQELKKTTTQLLFLNLYIRKSIGYGS